MTKKQFYKTMASVKELLIRSIIGNDYEYTAYLQGYQYGIRKLYHGDDFGEPIILSIYKNGIKQNYDKKRRYISIGYNNAIEEKQINVFKTWRDQYQIDETSININCPILSEEKRKMFVCDSGDILENEYPFAVDSMCDLPCGKKRREVIKKNEQKI